MGATIQSMANRRLGSQRPTYEPTPEQIAAACAAIRVGWSDDEYSRRAGSADRIRPVEFRPVHVRPAVYDAFDLGKL